MYTEVFWIETPEKGKIGIMPRPRGGDWLKEEISNLKNEQVDSIVSLLTYFENSELELTKEQKICERFKIDFFSIPIEDRDVPESIYKIIELISVLQKMIKEGKNIAIHCRQGIGRSSLIAASVLTTFGIPVKEIFNRIESSRGRSVPDTKEQRK
ncbi:MAG: tyrosine protein phosphatase [Desulfobacterales bacterium]|nr:tyrosine protein phosphatase [Desulfobacterales bacterium]